MWKIKVNGERVFKSFNTLILAVISIICLYPILYCLFASFSESSLLMANEGVLLSPIGFQLNAYEKVFQNPMIFIGYKNTIIILMAGVAVNMALTILGAYFLASKGIMFKNVILILCMFTMYFSGGLIPTYLTVKSLGLDNSLWALIFPTAINTTNMIIMRTGFAAIPDSMREAAKIDGANDFQVLVKIFLPLTKATIAVITLYYAVSHWNSWFQAAIYINDRTSYPLQLVLREILISNDTTSMMGGAETVDVQGIALSIKYATIIVSTLPILVIYPFIQKYFVAGVMIGSVKG